MAMICHCEAVRSRTIVDAIKSGATTLDQLKEACGVALGCGGCEPAIGALLIRHCCERTLAMSAPAPQG
jgi:bacterioferritin-associated ferredoxin